MSESFKGLIAVAGISGIEKVVNLATFFSLSFWLTPEEYGLFALAWIFIAVVEGFFEFGGGLGFLSDREDATKIKRILNGAALVWASFWASACLILGLAIFSIGHRLIGEILLSLSLVILLRTVSYPCGLMFLRDQNYLAMAITTLVPTIVGGSTGIVLAINDSGVWALVGRYLASVVACCVIVLLISPYTHSIRINFSRTLEWMKFGWKFSLSNNLGWLIVLQSEQLIIGSTLGPSVLGLYNFAKKPVDITGQIWSQVERQYFLPVFTREKKSADGVILFSVILGGLAAVVCIPACWMVMELIRNYWPSQWAPAIDLLPIFFLLIPVLVIESPIRSHLAAIGYSGVILKITILSAFASVMMIAACAFTSNAVELIIYGMLAINLSRLSVLIFTTLRCGRQQLNVLIASR